MSPPIVPGNPAAAAPPGKGLPRPGGRAALRPVPANLSVWLDLFRGLAALAVCICHVRAVVMVDFVPATSGFARLFYLGTGFGPEAVIIFFVLSGYLVGGEVLRRLQTGVFVGREYAMKRLSRLYAVYLAALLLGALWDNVGWRFCNAHGRYTTDWLPTMLPHPIAGQLTWTTLLGNVAFTQTLLVPTFGSNSPLWSLANEAWYYLLFPLLAWPLLARGSRRSRLSCLIVAAAVIWFIRGQVLLYFSVWLLGIIPHLLTRPLLRSVWWPALALVAALGLSRGHYLPFLPAFGVHLLIAACFVLVVNSLEHRPVRLPGTPGLPRFLAGFSYTLYLTHWPLALLLAASLEQWFGLGCRMPFGPTACGLWALLIGIIYVYAWAVADLTERHTAGLRRWLMKTAGLPMQAPATNKP